MMWQSKKMDIEAVISMIADHQTPRDIELLCETLIKINVYFHVVDQGEFADVDHITFTNLHKPTVIPCKTIEDITYAVFYTTKRLAMSTKPSHCRTARIHGLEAVKMIHGMRDVSGLIIQGNRAWLGVGATKIQEILDKHTKQ